MTTREQSVISIVLCTSCYLLLTVYDTVLYFNDIYELCMSYHCPIQY